MRHRFARWRMACSQGQRRRAIDAPPLPVLWVSPLMRKRWPNLTRTQMQILQRVQRPVAAPARAVPQLPQRARWTGQTLQKAPPAPFAPLLLLPSLQRLLPWASPSARRRSTRKVTPPETPLNPNHEARLTESHVPARQSRRRLGRPRAWRRAATAGLCAGTPAKKCCRSRPCCAGLRPTAPVGRARRRP